MKIRLMPFFCPEFIKYSILIDCSTGERAFPDGRQAYDLVVTPNGVRYQIDVGFGPFCSLK